VKTTIYLPERTKQRLARAAQRRHRSEAELIREAIDRLLYEEAGVRKPTLGIFDSGDPSFAGRADDALAEGFGKDGDRRVVRKDDAAHIGRTPLPYGQAALR
jgi:hypothetical protein